MNPLRSELIGRQAKVIGGKNPALVGISGKISDETKNMLLIKNENGTKKLIKSDCILSVKIEGRDVVIDGKQIAKRPEDRVGMKIQE
jgi:RNase P/RNase MRP subunit p29